MECNRKRHCWECLRRSLVCDFTQPGCKRCSASGTACPGYGPVQPRKIKWLSPGQVKSRKAKRTSKTSAATPGFEIKTDIHTFFQAVEYFNTRISPGIAPILELGSNNAIYQVTPRMFQMGIAHPDYVRLGMVCMSISHRMNQTRDDPQSNALAVPLLHYRGIIIRSLSKAIDVGHKRTSNRVFAGILTLLIADAQQGVPSSWQHHLQGARRIIALRGGMRSFAESAGAMPLLLLFVRIAVMGDMMSPATDFSMAPSQLEELDTLMEQYGNMPFAFQGFPVPVFAEIIKINYLRMRAAKQMPTGTMDFTHEAFEILNRIQQFSPGQWAESKPSAKRDDWVLLGKIHQTALALYCINSLQSLSVLPQIPSLRGCRVSQSQQLQTLLERGLPVPSINLFMPWPLIVLGVEAVNGGVAMRAFVQEQLPDMSRRTGMLAPLTAKNVLQGFWDSGETSETGWDSCFDRPYAFVMDPAVNVSKL